MDSEAEAPDWDADCDELALLEPVCSLAVQNKRTVTLEKWMELELDAEAASLLADEPDAPFCDWLELLLDDCDDELCDFSSVMIKPLIPLPPWHAKWG